MTQPSTLTVESTEVIPTDSNSFKNSSPDHTHQLRKAQDEHERRVLNYTARLAEANEQLRREIKKHRNTEERLLKEQQSLCHLYDLRDRDRQMVSHKIHDGLAQKLVAAIMQLRTFSRLIVRPGNDAWTDFEIGLQRLSECMREARQLLDGLRSPVLDGFGVVDAIEDIIAQDRNPDEPEISFVHHLDRERLPPSLENVIFRIVQESLTNARRYSQSDRLLVRLTQRDDNIRIEVQDWGIGFNPREVGDGHFGLEGIQERARLFGGSATIKSVLGKGTRIVVQLPLGRDVDTVTPATEPNEVCRQATHS